MSSSFPTTASPSGESTGTAGEVVRFEDVSFRPASSGESAYEHISLVLEGGTLAVTDLDPAFPETPLADAAQGLRTPLRGAVRWKGEDWGEMNPWKAARSRGEIGRVFANVAWVSNLNVNENILLRARHHDILTAHEAEAEAEELARFFGLADLPRGRPGTLSRHALMRAQLVRAFCAAPALILLEHPETGLPASDLDLLIEAVRRACARGAAVLWLAREDLTAHAGALKPDNWYVARGPGLQEAERS